MKYYNKLQALICLRETAADSEMQKKVLDIV